MYQYQYPAPYELYHHGIKGQKWGVRRFKKENGQLTPAGKNRYSKEERKALKKAERQQKLAEWNKPWNQASASNKRKRVAAVIGTVAVATLLREGAKAYLRGRAYMQANNIAVDTYATLHGLKEVKGGATLGLKQVNNGKRIVNKIIGG